MQRQMSLWSEPQEHAMETEAWQKFNPEAQRVLITTLARLIVKALCIESLADPQEVNNESK
jgi:hypothetical protein